MSSVYKNSSSDDLFGTASFGGGGGRGTLAPGVCTADDPYGENSPTWTEEFTACVDTVIGGSLGTDVANPDNFEEASKAGIACAGIATINTW